MSKLFSITISLLILFQSLNIHFDDVLKFREVIEHAELHMEKYDDTFFVYVSKHFGDLKELHKHQHQEEEKEHNHPPIQHDCSSQTQNVFVSDALSFSIENPKQITKASTNFYYQDKFSTFEKQRVFQPPRV